jgi:hypothetical protein
MGVQAHIPKHLYLVNNSEGEYIHSREVALLYKGYSLDRNSGFLKQCSTLKKDHGLEG